MVALVWARPPTPVMHDPCANKARLAHGVAKEDEKGRDARWHDMGARRVEKKVMMCGERR
jgi:hypothetical protein